MNARSSIRAGTALLVGFLGAPGCSSAPRPTFTVVRAAVTESTPDGVAVRIELAARNDHDDALPLKRVSYRLFVDGREVFRGTRSPEATLRRFGTQTVTIPAVIPAGAAEGVSIRGLPFRVEGSMTYVTTDKFSEILFDAGIREPSAVFSGSGVIASEQAAADSVQGRGGHR